ncbi:replication initiation protein RepM [Acinetobacter baumannii]|uniref:replication initiation protein RepM n=1 Tax=Acinetobacter baumannii TaxID=470 RepID=UPI000DE6C862|nr:replication initiation protein RepM [Acinetobacter baumannii]SSV41504.1 DNA replication protein [Acinetobacter baumannii]
MDLVVKDNNLINASYSLGLVEQRLVLLAIIEARESSRGIDSETFLEIHAQHYADRFDVDVKNTYSMLSDAAQTLFNRQVTYMTIDEKRNKPEKRVVRWVSGISYVEGAGVLKLRFSPEIVPLITRLEQNFTSYELEQVKALNVYATRLYELLVCWRSTGKTPIIEIEDFRSKIGVLQTEYKLMSDFKKRVFEPAIIQINERTDLTVSYEQHKTGRTISGFSFKFKQKKTRQTQKTIATKRDLNTPDFFIKMTDAQRHLFANKMSEMPEMSKYSQGTESYQQFAVRIADMLLEPEKFRELYPILEKLGFKP